MIKAFLLIFLSCSLHAAINVERVNVACSGSSDCGALSGSLDFLKRSYVDEDHLSQTIKLYVLNEGISSFEYELVKTRALYVLNIKMGVKEVLVDYSIVAKEDPGLDLPTVLPIREGHYVDKKALEKTRSLLRDVLQGQGYPDADVRFESTKVSGGEELKLRLYLGAPIVVDEIRVISDSDVLRPMTVKALSRFKGKNFHLQAVKNELESLRQLFIDFGYYLAEVDMNVSSDADREVKLDISVKSNDLHVFYIEGNKAIRTDKIKTALKNSVLGYKRRLPVDTVNQRVKSLYENMGFVRAEIKTTMTNYKDFNGEEVNRYNVVVTENERPKLEKVRFTGNSSINSDLLRAIFYAEGPSVIKSGYFQRDYALNFTERIREEYIINGYVNVFVDEPRIYFVEDKVFFNYRIREGVRAIVKDVVIKGVNAQTEADLKEILDNRSGKHFNPVTFKSDLELIESRLRQQGYYYSKIKNKNGKNIVNYKNDNSSVEITIEIELGQQIEADQIIIIGNRKTRAKLIRRELVIESGELVTRKKIQQSQTRLLGLGIFSSVLIEPVPNNSGKADILVSVREKDFGLVELAPGIRTDIGLKVSTNITYNNLDGMNKRISFKGQVNQRFNLNSLDERRRQESNSLVEYDLATTYAENHIFDSGVDFSSSISTSRKRFFSFDADIQRINFTFNKVFTSWLSASLRPQFETIRQFDATSELDEGTFQIGSLTPGVTMDFRNNRINPTSGAWFNMSVEVANPALLSQQTSDLTIDYYKFVSRSRFYVPFSGGTVAMSLAAGVEENLANPENGYIPNIKVFRLNGVDIVRGFEDNEINRLPEDGLDISQEKVDEKAYMAVIKIEPRVFLSDTTMLGVFYDAGRVFVNKFEPNELRSSVGISFKYLTPVGSLDFDYGIKLLRKTYDDGMVDSPGRLHVSIGFF